MPRTPRTRDEEKEYRRQNRIAAKAVYDAAADARTRAQQTMWAAQEAELEARAALERAITLELRVIDGEEVPDEAVPA
jgi:TPP-dependent pyruvate/acetoin dehydrogenase alpha subunit